MACTSCCDVQNARIRNRIPATSPSHHSGFTSLVATAMMISKTPIISSRNPSTDASAQNACSGCTKAQIAASANSTPRIPWRIFQPVLSAGNIRNSLNAPTTKTTPMMTPIVVIDDSSKRSTTIEMMNHRNPVTRKTHQAFDTCRSPTSVCVIAPVPRWRSMSANSAQRPIAAARYRTPRLQDDDPMRAQPGRVGECRAPRRHGFARRSLRGHRDALVHARSRRPPRPARRRRGPRASPPGSSPRRPSNPARPAAARRCSSGTSHVMSCVPGASSAPVPRPCPRYVRSQPSCPCATSSATGAA